jgi:hypothetical protein
LLLVALPLSAQPDHPNCRGVLQATLSSGNEHPHVQACAREIVPELAATIRASSTQPDLTTLTLLHRLSSVIRDPALFQAGIDLANSGAAIPAARVLGLSVALTQVDPRLSFQGAGAERPFEAPLSDNCAEASFLVLAPGGYWADNGTHGAAASVLLTLSQSLSEGEAAPLMVRRFARCLALILPASDDPSYAVPDWSDAENTGFRF